MKTSVIHAQMRRERDSKRLLDQARQYAYEYIDAVDERSVFPDETAIQNLDRFDEPLPEGSQSGAGTLDLLNTYGAPATVAQTGGRCFGFVNGGVVPAALAARWMADAWDQNPALYVMSPVVGKLEQVCENWVRELLELPDGTVADYVSGSSSATLRYLGRNGVAALIDGMCERAAQFSRQLAAHRFRILNEVVFNQVLVAGDTPAQTRAILANIQASGVCWCGGTQWDDQPAIRISVSSWVTTSEDVDRSVEAFVDARSKARRDDTGGR